MEPREHNIAEGMEAIGKLVEKVMVKSGVPQSGVGDSNWWRKAKALGDACVRELERLAERRGRS